MKLALVVAHLHPKNDKRVMRTVNALAEVVYRCCNPDLDAEFINLMWTRFYEDLLSQIPLNVRDCVWDAEKKNEFIQFCTDLIK